MKKILALCTLLAGCASTPNTEVPPQKPNSEDTSRQQIAALLIQTRDAITDQNIRQALQSADQAIHLCQQRSAGNAEGTRIYAARSSTESLYYLLIAAAENQNAVVGDTDCADALWLKAFALVDRGELEQAESLLQQAIELSPQNSLYLSELGHVYHSNQQWQLALDTFTRASKASEFSPPSEKLTEQTRALRGMGYSLIELGRLDEAETIYQQCLTLDPTDQSASNELTYIRNLRANN